MKVGDFGLAEDVYTRGYFRQGKDDAVKLPFKWMAPESLGDGLFSEKSDVVSGGCRYNECIAIIQCMATLCASGHLASHVGKCSVLGEFLTLVWMP